MKIPLYVGSRERGLATLEFALVTPVLLIILLVTFEFTRAFYQQNTLTKAVRDATRYLSSNSFKGDFFDVTEDEKAEAINLAVFGNISGDGLKVADYLDVSDFTYAERMISSGGIPLEHVQISVSYDFEPLWPILRGMTFLNADRDISALVLTATSTMRALK